MIPRQGCENLLSGNQEDRDKAGKTLNRGWFVLLDMIVEWSDTIASAFRVMAFARPYLRFGISEAVPTGLPEMKSDLTATRRLGGCMTLRPLDRFQLGGCTDFQSHRPF